MNKLTLNDTINVGRNKKVLVSDLVGIKGEIFKYIKKGFYFDDEVLEKAGIKRTVREVKVYNVFVEHDKKQKVKVYPKETESLKNILKSLHTLDNQTNDNFGDKDYNEETEDNVSSNYINNEDDD